ncbi:uncharacterized protein LOC143915580 [Arctopsyche grandis]|uniref:uncharacterized protein LOC143915580 n=1 Tax=Arctopsyche grandis TaxID=121162 RepID=UPI00406D7106
MCVQPRLLAAMSVVMARGVSEKRGASHGAQPPHNSPSSHPAAPHAALMAQAASLAPASAPSCKECADDISEIELHAEIEHLKRHLAERDAHIEAMESEFLKGNTRIAELEEQIVTWREKYDRLYDSHRRVQRLNQNLEEKLLQMVDKCSEDKSQLTRDVETLSVRLAESNCAMGHLHKENERYKNDMNLAIQLLQCKPDNFVSQKFDSLPPDTQARVSSYIMSKAKLNQDSTQPGYQPGKNPPLISEKVNPDDFEFNISASLMSKILEESVQNTISSHCDTCTCLKKSANPFSFNKSQHSVGIQTILRHENMKSVCFNCNSDIISLNSSLSGKCSSPLSGKVLHEEKDMIQIGDTEKSNSLYSLPQNKSFLNEKCNRSGEQLPTMKSVKPNEDNVKLVSLKHREIMTKIGEDLKKISLKDHYGIPTLEPITGHHRLCDRTKSSLNTDVSNIKFEDGNDLSKKLCKSTSQSSSIHKSALSVNVADITFGEIENSILMPNTMETKISALPTKADLNSISNKIVFHGSSVSSNDAESKTSSNKSYQNGSHNGSNPKVHIGPGPRFCSLIMQAGSKNILLDNAQPNIAPVLYTRQSKHMDNPSPLTPLYNNNTLDMPMKHTATLTDLVSDFGVCDKKSNSPNLNGGILDSVDNILDLPIDDMAVKNPIDLIEKPESGYKSNESAEIIDKLLFGVDNIIPDDLDKNILQTEIVLQIPEFNGDIVGDEPNIDMVDGGALVVNENDQAFQNDIIDNLFSEPKALSENLKMFNFDHYEKSLKHSTSLKTQKDVLETTIVNDLEHSKLTSDAHAFLKESAEIFTSNFDLKIASKNLSEINKKFQITNQVMPENTLEKPKEWKKGTSTEKSSSSLSSDDSAAVLQKQQLIRVAEWVQKNLEMEQQIEFDNSDSCPQSAEEMHHVRNDFPRPAKVDHRIRKNNLKTSHKTSHHLSKHSFNTKSLDNTTNTPVELCNSLTQESNTDNRLSYGHDMINFNADTAEASNAQNVNEMDAAKRLKRHQSLTTEPKMAEDFSAATNCTTKLYTKEELARMEYNVKQFLLNGTRWTKGGNEQYYSRARRTSSKTETDL